jgi:hypothetical protein
MRFAPAALIRLLPRWSVVIFYTSRKSKIWESLWLDGYFFSIILTIMIRNILCKRIYSIIAMGTNQNLSRFVLISSNLARRSDQ